MIDNPSLAAKLVALTRNWDQHTLVSDAEKNMAVEIGKALNEAGGIRLMREAYFSAKSCNRNAMVVAAYWCGIGGWLT